MLVAPYFMNLSRYKVGNLCGILAPLLWASAIIVCGRLRPEYSHYTQYISELGERGSSTEFIMRYERLSSGVLSLWVPLFATKMWQLEAHRVSGADAG